MGLTISDLKKAINDSFIWKGIDTYQYYRTVKNLKYEPDTPMKRYLYG